MDEIILVLDKSASMQTFASDAVGGYNSFLKAQKEVPGDANLTVIWFDQNINITTSKLSECKELEAWPRGGMTALDDAIGNAFITTKERFNKEKPKKVILAILTDGFENSSREFSQQQTAALIKEHREKYGWEVIFLAADQDARMVAEGYNINLAQTFCYDSHDTQEGFRSMNAAVTLCRANTNTGDVLKSPINAAKNV